MAKKLSQASPELKSRIELRLFLSCAIAEFMQEVRKCQRGNQPSTAKLTTMSYCLVTKIYAASS